jgi:hypothetical protein
MREDRDGRVYGGISSEDETVPALNDIVISKAEGKGLRHFVI